MRSALAVGLVWGVFCGIANGIPVATTLAQMAVPWIWVAAFVAFRVATSTRQAALLGALTLLAANVAYVGVEYLAPGMSGQARFFALWTIVGLIVGPVAGVVGRWLTTEEGMFRAVVMLAAVSIAEPLALWAHIDNFDAHLTYLLVAASGITFPLVWFGRDGRKALQSLALSLLLAYPVAVVLEAALIALGQISPPMRLI